MHAHPKRSIPVLGRPPPKQLPHVVPAVPWEGSWWLQLTPAQGREEKRAGLSSSFFWLPCHHRDEAGTLPSQIFSF